MNCRLVATLGVPLAIICTVTVQAQSITTDGTLGTTVSFDNTTSTFTIDDGIIVNGQNQFHSFGQFDLANGQTANFTYTGPESILNIISRVTGGTQSDIFGTIRSTIDGANLWLINPAGVMFGFESSLDISGSLHVSSADYLVFGDESLIFAVADVAPDLSLLAGDPTGFGFGPNPTGNVWLESAQLTVPAGETISLVGHEVSLQDFSSLVAPGGILNLVSVGSEGVVTLLTDGGVDTGSITYDTGTSSERVYMTGESTLDVSGVGGGSIYIRGGQFVMGTREADDETILADTTGGTNGGVIDIRTVGDVSLQGRISATTSGGGAGGDIVIISGGRFGTRTRDGGIAGGTEILTSTTGSGAAGSISITASHVDVDNSAEIQVESSGSGDAGDINIAGGSMAMNVSGTAGISSNTSDTGAGGDINITLTGDLFVQDGQISAETSGQTNGGAAGNISISAANISNAQGFDVTTTSRGDGVGGDIEMTANSAINLNAGTIRAEAESSGAGGSIMLNADQITLEDHASLPPIEISTVTRGSGSAGSISLNANSILIWEGASVVASTSDSGDSGDSGDAGDIEIHAEDQLEISGDQTEVASRSTTATSGSAGSISITGGDVSVNANARLTVSTDSDNTSNAAGSININSSSISIQTNDLANPAISATTSGASDGGSISLTAADISIIDSLLESSTTAAGDGGNISLTGTSSVNILNSILSAGTRDAGNGGSILVDAGLFNIEDSDLLANSLSAQGSAGSILITADDANVIHSFIEAATSGIGTGGNIQFDVANFLYVGSNGSGTTDIRADTQGAANGGSISFLGGTVLISDGASVSATTNAAGNGGDITFNNADLTVTNGGTVEASTSGSGSAGTITIDTSNLFEVYGGGHINANTTGTGAGGSIALLGNSVLVSDGGLVSATTSTGASGGDITLGAADTLIEGTGIVSASTAGSGTGGNIIANGTNLAVANGGTIEASTNNVGNAGSITMDLGGLLEVLAGGQINSTSIGTESGAAGSIDVVAESIRITDDGRISVSTESTIQDNEAGSISLTAIEDITIDNGGTDNIAVEATTSRASSGGAIVLDAPVVLIQNGTISANTTGPGAGGSIFIVSDDATVAEDGVVSASSSGSGLGGNIDVSGSNLTIVDGGTIIASATGTGNGGGINVDVDGTLGMENANIIATSNQSDGGSISINAGDLILMSDSNIETSALGDAGNIRIGQDTDPATPAFLIINGNTVQANAGATGGAINVHAQYILGADNVFEAISQTGNDGEIVFDAPATDLVSVVAQLSAPILNAAQLLDNQCAVSAMSDRSSFVISGPRTPPSPDYYLQSDYLPTTAIGPGVMLDPNGNNAPTLLFAQGGC